MGYKPNYKHRFWSMSIISIMLLALWIGTIVQRNGLWHSLEAKEIELAECGVGWYVQLELTAVLMELVETCERPIVECTREMWNDYSISYP